ncbi:ribonuclease H-like domain-containing protein, partial [Mycena sanguinolenta]
MQAFRRLFQSKFFWVIILACFLHSLNTLVGEIFFNGSHYWGGQLKSEATRLKITRGLKTKCDSRWYALVLLCVSVAAHQQPLSIICLRPDAQKKTNGLSAVATDVISTVLHDATFWPLLRQLTRVTKPIVDAIGNCESRQATLADCMLQLIRCARTMSTMVLEENEDEGFLTHAKETFDRRFKLIATPIHWLALFLHPLCRKLAVSETVHGHSLDYMIEEALKVARQWRWEESKARQLVKDLKAYYHCRSPFAGGQKNAREWWEAVPKEHGAPLRNMAIVLASIVPHAAEVERLFSELGGIQTPRRSLLSVDTMEKTGKIRSRLNYELYEQCRAAGKSGHRKHNHMHTSDTPGIDADLAKDLESPITWIPLLEGANDEEEEDIVEKASQDLQRVLDDEEPSRNTPGSVTAGEFVSFEELERIERGEMTGIEEDNVDIVGGDAAGAWNIEDLM